MRTIALQGGQIDFTPDVPNALAATLKGNPSLQVVPTAATGGERIAVSCRMPPTDDVRVRQALSLAIDRNAVNQAAWGGFGIPATREVPPSIPQYYNSEPLSNYAYNPKAAQALLNSYMADKGLQQMPPITLESIPGVGLSNLYGPVITANLAALNWTVNFVTLDASTWVPKLSAPFGQHQIDNGFCSTNVPAQYIPNFFAYMSGAAKNYSDYSNPQMDTLIQQLLSASSVAETASVVLQLEVLVNTELPNIYLVWPQKIYGLSAKVQGFQPSGIAIDARMRNLWLKP